MGLMLLKRISFLTDYSYFSIFVCTLIINPLGFCQLLGAMTDSFQSIPSDCMQNRGQNVFNRAALRLCRKA